VTCLGGDPALRDAVAIAAGSVARCAVTAGGGVRCAGAHAPPLEKVRKVAVGEFQACALHEGGKVTCWGFPRPDLFDLDRQVRVRSEPVEPPGVADAVDIAVGTYALVAARADGRVVAWNGNLEIGGDTEPHPLPGFEGATAVAAAGDRACALGSGGDVRCANVYDRSSPPQRLLAGGAVRLAVGPSHACVVLRAGQVACWGDNTNGKVGNGRSNFRFEPAPVVGLPR
jgi:alpha-tubulin suppressor-like RCC1 family protein